MSASTLGVNVLQGPPVLRLWLCLSLLLFAPIRGGFLPSIEGDVCTQSCPDDDANGKCAPDCADCACCGHVRTVALPLSGLSSPAPVPRPRLVAHEEDEPPSADVGDILHVPRAALA